MSKWLPIAVVFSVGLTACAVPTVDETEGPTADDPRAMCGNPFGCDDPWLSRCRAKGGLEETQPGGIRMCCRTNSSGKECVSDPDLWPSRRLPAANTVSPVVTNKAP